MATMADAAIMGRLRILCATCSAGERAVNETMQEAEHRADDGAERMTYAEAWETAAQLARQSYRNGTPRSEAEAYVTKVAALADEMAAAAQDQESAQEIAAQLIAEYRAEKDAAQHRAAAGLGWKWAHIAVMSAGMTLGWHALDDAQDIRAAADQLADAGWVRYVIREGRMHICISSAGEMAWLTWHQAVSTGGYITLGPEPENPADTAQTGATDDQPEH